MPIPETLTVAAGRRVRHREHGEGEVRLDDGEVVIVRFGQETISVFRADLDLTLSVADRIANSQWDKPLPAIARAQALTIRSLNDEWGVFAAARIDLLPHQLWVCRQVTGQWPTRWLIADDVGLGKTIEAGMIISALRTRGNVRRILVLCPANLVPQWQQRMLDMFGIRLAQYSTEADSERSEFWRVHEAVVASFHTLRKDRRGRRERLMAAAPFDLVVVDEAHHLNDDEATGETQAFRLLRDLESEGRIRSMAFFTGTPHRGKDYGFFSLLSLLRSDLFSADGDPRVQSARLKQVMIRNNKANVTDLNGNRLFQPLQVQSEEYKYSPAEARFYELLTTFILDGQMYARSLTATKRSAVMLALIALQKLASSSVAAIRHALLRRLTRISAQNRKVEEMNRRLREMEADGDWDGREDLEWELHLSMQDVALSQNEEESLRVLLAAAGEVVSETKISTLLDAIDSRFPDRSILFFTEYKATQALLLAALQNRFGKGCAAFINGDERLVDIPAFNGAPPVGTLEIPRAKAAEQFNTGKVRFLISTEAGGEGIDLHHNCHTLIHVDLPWNPMRLHQRVGRVNRYGQKRQVEVLMLHNPDTVESRIWSLLNAKLERITAALGQVMEDPEDMTQLVLGMESPGSFNELFTQAMVHRREPKERLASWFDKKTARIGGQDVVTVVREMLGNAARFDFGDSSFMIPRIDLSELRPFLENALVLGGRRPFKAGDGNALAFRTPDEWRKGQPGVRSEYDHVVFVRDAILPPGGRLMGVGDPLMDVALAKMSEDEASAARIPHSLLVNPLFVFRVFSRETLGAGGPQPNYAGVTVENGAGRVLGDADLLRLLNRISGVRNSHRSHEEQAHSDSPAPIGFVSDMEIADQCMATAIAPETGSIRHRFRTPGFELVAAFVPDPTA